MRCTHSYEKGGKECPHDANPDTGLCFWHEQTKGKVVSGGNYEGLDLEEAYLAEATITGASFRNAVLDGAVLELATIESTDLGGISAQSASFVKAQMREALLPGAKLKYATFDGAILGNSNLERADLSWASFRGALLPGASLQQATMLDANLEDATLLRASMEKAVMRGAVLDRADLQIADLRGVDLRNSMVRGTNMRGADLRGSDMKYAVMEDAILSNANLQKTDMARCQLEGALIQSANLKKSNLREANLENAILSQSILVQATLRGAALNGANVDGAILHGADLFNAKIEEIRNLRYADMNTVQITEELGDADASEKNFVSAVKRYDEAISAYIALKNHFNKEGLYDKAGQYYIREWSTKAKLQTTATRLDTEQLRANRFIPYYLPTAYAKKESRLFRMILTAESKGKWLFNKMLYYSSLYGESPLRVLMTSLFVMAFYAMVYWITGGITPDDAAFVPTLSESLYFSVVTFTTLGYGDYHPKQAYQTIAISEAFIGAFILAFFVVVVSRRLVR